jgi:hypothetical protein
MTRLTFTITAWLVLASFGVAAEPYRTLTPDEARALSIQARRFQRAIDGGDSEAFMKMTHPAIFRCGFTRDNWARAVRQNMRTVAAVTKLEGFRWGTISPVYLSDTDEVCFITRTYISQVVDMRFHIVDYLIAARDVGTSEWFFVTGGNTGENPSLMWILFRDLPKDLKLPPYKATQLN